MRALSRIPGRGAPLGAGLFSRTPPGRVAAPPETAPALRSATAFAFGSPNHLENADQHGLRLPPGASALPLVTEDWVQGFFFGVDEMLRQQAVTYVLASKGPASGANNTKITLRGGLEGGGVTPLSLHVASQNAALRSFGVGFSRTDSLERGAAYLLVYGQKGSFPFMALVRVLADGDSGFEIVSNQVGTANDGPNSWKYVNGSATAPAWGAAGAYDFLSGLGGSLDLANGSNRASAGGSFGHFFNVWGSFPFTAGLPDAATLLELAQGRLDGAGLAERVSGTLRYGSELKGPGELAADPRGVLRDAPTVEGTNPSVQPFAAAPLRQPPTLRLRAYGDRFVLPLREGQRRGEVPFVGTFSGVATSDSFEARLLRTDTGAELTGWTVLDAAIDASSRRFLAVLRDIPAAVGFRREIRWRGRPETVVNGGDRLALGLVIVDLGQSQLAYQGYAQDDNSAGGGGRLHAPTPGGNVFLSVLKQPSSGHAQGQGFGGARGGVSLFQPYKPDQHGDGNVHSFEAIRRLAGLPVMLVDTAVPGSHPNSWTFDRKPFSYTTLSAPDGTTSQFTFTPTATALNGEGATIAPSVVPGSLHIECGAVTVNDDGAGNLVGAGITGGTIDYGTGRIANLAFAVPPAAGTVPTGRFRLFSTAPETSQTIAAGRWSLWGEEGRPLDRTNRTGRLAAHLARLRGLAPSLYRVFWYTSMESPAGIPAFGAIMDRLKARLDAFYPAGAGAPWAIGFPGRSVAAASDERAVYRPMAVRQREWAAARPFVRSLGDYLDMELANNVGPHQSPNVGTKTLGERLGVGCAALWTPGLGVDGPVLREARFTDASREVIELLFDMRPGTSLRTAEGNTTGLTGFRVAPPGAAASGWLETGFSATIAGPDRIAHTAAEGSAFVSEQRVAFGNGSPVSTGSGAAGEATDNASLLRMPSDDDGWFAGVEKYARSGRKGNSMRMFDNVTVQDA